MTNIEDIWPVFVKDVYGVSTSPDNGTRGIGSTMQCSGYECTACGKRIIPMTTKGKGNATGRMRSHIEAHFRRGEFPEVVQSRN